MAHGKILVVLITFQTVLTMFGGFLILNQTPPTTSVSSCCCRRRTNPNFSGPTKTSTVVSSTTVPGPSGSEKVLAQVIGDTGKAPKTDTSNSTGNTDTTTSAVNTGIAGPESSHLQSIKLGVNGTTKTGTKISGKKTTITPKEPEKPTLLGQLNAMGGKTKVAEFIKGYQLPSAEGSPTSKYVTLFKYNGKYFYKVETRKKKDASVANELVELSRDDDLIKPFLEDPEAFYASEYSNYLSFKASSGGIDYDIDFVTPRIDKGKSVDKDPSYDTVNEIFKTMSKGISSEFKDGTDENSFKIDELIKKSNEITDDVLKIAIKKRGASKASSSGTGELKNKSPSKQEKKKMYFIKGFKLPCAEEKERKKSFRYFSLYKFEGAYYYELETGDKKEEDVNDDNIEELTPDTAYVKRSLDDSQNFCNNFSKKYRHVSISERSSGNKKYEVGLSSPTINRLSMAKNNKTFAIANEISDIILKGINVNFDPNQFKFDEMRDKSFLIEDEPLRISVMEKDLKKAVDKSAGKIEFIKGVKFPSTAEGFRYLAIYKQDEKYFFEVVDKTKKVKKSKTKDGASVSSAEKDDASVKSAGNDDDASVSSAGSDAVSINDQSLAGNELEELSAETDFIKESLKNKYFVNSFLANKIEFTTPGADQYLVVFSSSNEKAKFPESNAKLDSEMKKEKDDDKEKEKQKKLNNPYRPYVEVNEIWPILVKGINADFKTEEFNFDELKQKAMEVTDKLLRITIELKNKKVPVDVDLTSFKNDISDLFNKSARNVNPSPNPVETTTNVNPAVVETKIEHSEAAAVDQPAANSVHESSSVEQATVPIKKESPIEDSEKEARKKRLSDFFKQKLTNSSDVNTAISSPGKSTNDSNTEESKKMSDSRTTVGVPNLSANTTNSAAA